MKNCTGILCPMQYGKVDPATCQAVDYCSYATPPKTNADRIRAMSDEELAQRLYLSTCAHIFDNKVECKDNGCKKCWLDWLKKEAE